MNALSCFLAEPLSIETSIDGHRCKVYLGDNYVIRVLNSTNLRHHKDVAKGVAITQIISQLNNALSEFVPETVGFLKKDNISISIYKRVGGCHPKALSQKLANDLGEFLARLHASFRIPVITDFCGTSFDSVASYFHFNMPKYLASIEAHVTEADNKLLRKVDYWIKMQVNKLNTPTDFVLLHKDIHEKNILTGDYGRLASVLDWDSAQSGPRELEFAVILQRFPLAFPSVIAAYKHPIDTELLEACTAFQCVRFWKSFPTQADFVDRQRAQLRLLLEKYDLD